MESPEDKPEVTKIVIFLALVFLVGIPMGNYFSEMIRGSKERLIAEQGILQIPRALERYRLRTGSYPQSIQDLIPEEIRGIVGLDFKPRKFKRFSKPRLVNSDTDSSTAPRVEFDVISEEGSACTIHFDPESKKWGSDGTQPVCPKVKDFFAQ